MEINPNQLNVNETIPPHQPAEEKPAPVVRPWRGWASFALGLIVIFAHFVTQLAVATAFIVVNIASGNLDLLRIADSLENGLAMSVTVIVSAIVGVVLTIVFIKMRKGITVKEYLGLKPVSKKTVFGLLALTAGLYGIALFIDYLTGEFGKPDPNIDIYRTSALPGLLWMALAVFAPVFEEFFFRGFLFAGFRQSRMRAGGAIVLTAFLWAILHIQYDIYGIATILVIGIIFGVARFKTGSIWSPLIMHAFWNFAVILMMALYSSGVIK